MQFRQTVKARWIIKTSPNMRYLFVSIILFVGLSVNSHAQKTKGAQFKVAFYNTENLFDTLHDLNKNDNDFLPDAKVAWTSKRYNHKLQNIARVLVAIDSVAGPWPDSSSGPHRSRAVGREAGRQQ